MNNLRRFFLVLVLALIVGAIYVINSHSASSVGKGEEVTVMSPALRAAEKDRSGKADTYERAKEITTPDGFVNTGGKPITISEFIGKKVILVDFWTYSCINCQRTTPYLNSWYEKYKDTGLVIIGIHTPEFEFEKNYENVKAATKKFHIEYPVVLDNDYSTWRAYHNRYWPRKYLIDIDGYIVYDHAGEGAYEETERKIQEALAERMAVLGEAGRVDMPVTREEKDGSAANSPETYFGANRNTLLGNGQSGVAGKQTGLIFPPTLTINSLYLSGDWDIAAEYAVNTSRGARIAYRYDAQDVFFVAEADTKILVEVTSGGKPLGQEAGADIIRTPDGKTIMKIQEARLYTIIQGASREKRTLEFTITSPGLRAYTFTFG